MKTIATLSVLVLFLTPSIALYATSDTIVTTAVVNAPIEEVWNAFTTKEGIESWMVAKTDMDLSIGGKWRTSYSKDSNLDDDAAIHQLILAYDPGRMLSFRTVKTPKDFPFPTAILKTWTVVYFDPAPNGGTKVTVRMPGYTEDKESQTMRAFFEKGNHATLDSLVKRFANKR